MQKIIIAAVSDNLAIGKENDLLWEMPADIDFFMNTIKNQWLITGRKSYESAQGSEVFTQPEKTVIITRRSNYEANGAAIVNTVQAAFDIPEKAGASTVYVLGGGEIYKQSIDFADILLITEIHATFEADIFFPEIDQSIWIETARTDHQKDEKNPYNYSFVRYERRK
jgi:dihydrofolate reductase